MAESKKVEAATDPMEELVEYTAPLIAGRSDRDIFVGVNGETIRIKRGETVRIKRKFKEVLDQAAKQEAEAYAYMEAAQRGSGKALKDLG